MSVCFNGFCDLIRFRSDPNLAISADKPAPVKVLSLPRDDWECNTKSVSDLAFASTAVVLPERRNRTVSAMIATGLAAIAWRHRSMLQDIVLELEPRTSLGLLPRAFFPSFIFFYLFSKLFFLFPLLPRASIHHQLVKIAKFIEMSTVFRPHRSKNLEYVHRRIAKSSSKGAH